MNHHAGIVEDLLMKGADPSKPTQVLEAEFLPNIKKKATRRNHPLHLASGPFADKLEVQILLRFKRDEIQAFVNQKNDLGETPLHFACAYGRLDIVELLVESTAFSFLHISIFSNLFLFSK